MIQTQNLLLAAGLCGLAMLAGCGKGSDVGAVPVSGKVTLDGEPLKDAIVTFSPTEGGAARPPAVGMTDSQGSFTLRTGEAIGAIPGRHEVRITESTGVGEGESLPDDRSLWKEPEQRIPEKYASGTELSFNVPPDGSDAANFDLKSDAK